MAEGDGRFVEYAGGYSDMLLQRGVAPKPDKKPKTARAAAPAVAPGTAPPRKRKLTFGEKHALEILPARIAALEKDIATLQARLSDGALYARDARAFAELADKLAAAKAELEAAEERWIELEILREGTDR
jgi:ATP-binding cassette subfamily F protein uup